MSFGAAAAEVVVLEARDRVGGRVWSRELENGSVVEMGAEFILEENTVVQETAERLGLDLLDKGMSYGRRELRGAEAFDPAELDAAVAEIERATAAGEGRGALGARAGRPTRDASGGARGPGGADRGVVGGTGGHRRLRGPRDGRPHQRLPRAERRGRQPGGSRSSLRAGSTAG